MEVVTLQQQDKSAELRANCDEDPCCHSRESSRSETSSMTASELRISQKNSSCLHERANKTVGLRNR